MNIPDGLDRAVRIIEERHDIKKFSPAKNILQRKIKYLEKMPTDELNYEELGICYYYDLRIQLKSHLHDETDENMETYYKMNQAFDKHETNLKAALQTFDKKSEEYAQKAGELQSFYNMIERYYYALETIYYKKNFGDAEKRVYGAKMRIKQMNFWINRSYGKWFEYAFLKITCDYGKSFLRWGVTGLSVAFVFGIIFYFMGASHFGGELQVSTYLPDYIYFSVVTFTTLGYGEIVPITHAARFLTAAEVFMGYVMLGMFIKLIQK